MQIGRTKAEFLQIKPGSRYTSQCKSSFIQKTTQEARLALAGFREPGLNVLEAKPSPV